MGVEASLQPKRKEAFRVVTSLQFGVLYRAILYRQKVIGQFEQAAMPQLLEPFQDSFSILLGKKQHLEALLV